MTIGMSKQLVASYNGKHVNDNLTYTSSDPNVATVDADGLVTAVGDGSATITAETYNGKQAECLVTVSDVPAQVVMTSEITMAVGMTDQKQMKAKFQLSYNARMILQAGWAVTAFLVPGLHFIAGAAPVLFPKVTILYLQAKGKLLPPDPERPAKPESTEEPQASSDDNL